jgi:mRNA interferase MazF
VDFGLAAKQRPVLILAYPQPDDARALVVVVPLTSQLRGCAEKWTSESPAGYPKHSAVNVQGLASIDQHALIRKLGSHPTSNFLPSKTQSARCWDFELSHKFGNLIGINLARGTQFSELLGVWCRERTVILVDYRRRVAHFCRRKGLVFVKCR